MEIRLLMNDYLDVYVMGNGLVHVEIGRFNKDGNAVRENSYVNSSFVTYMKHMGIDVSDIDKEIIKYIVDNQLYLRIKRNSTNSGLDYCLHDVVTREELISYSSFDELVNTEVFQMQNGVN